MSANITIPTIGATVDGTVKLTLSGKDGQKKPYGVIVNLDGGASGLLHVSEMKGGSFNGRTQRLTTLKKGDKVTVEVIDVKTEGEKARIALSEKSIEERSQREQQQSIAEALTPETEVTGKVSVVKESFAIVTISDGPAAGLGALLHVSQLSGATPKERDAALARMQVGQTVTAEVVETEVEDGRLKIRLSLRAAAMRKQLERFGTGTKHTGTIVKRLDHGFVVNFGAVTGILSDEDACTDKLKVGNRVSARVSFVSGDGKVTLTRRGLK